MKFSFKEQFFGVNFIAQMVTDFYIYVKTKAFKQVNFPAKCPFENIPIHLATAKFLRLLPKKNAEATFLENKAHAYQPALLVGMLRTLQELFLDIVIPFRRTQSLKVWDF